MPKTKSQFDDSYIPSSIKNMLRGVIGNSKNQSFTKEVKARKVSALSNLEKLIFDSRTDIEPEKYRDYLELIHSRILREAPILLKTKLGFTDQLYPDGKEKLKFEDEISWVANRLALSSRRITSFRTAVLKLEDDIWSNDVSGSFYTLKEIEEITGDCIWLIEANTSCNQIFGGLERQKHWVEKLKKRTRRSLAGFVAHYVSVRNEPTVTPSRFRSRVQDNIEKINGQDDIKVYLRFKLLDEFPNTKHGLSSILRVAQRLNIFDLYEAIIAIIQIIISERRFEHLRNPLMKKTIDTLTDIDDFRLIKAKNCLQQVGKSKGISYSRCGSVESLTSGKIATSAKESIRSYKKNPSDLNQLIYFSLAQAHHDRKLLTKTSGSPFSDIARKMAITFSKVGGT